MATRRYHKKSAKCRKVGRKSRKVRGGKLRTSTGERITNIKEFDDLHGVIRSKTETSMGIITKDLYQIKIDGDKMTWIPLAGNLSNNLARASIGLQNTGTGLKNAAENTKEMASEAAKQAKETASKVATNASQAVGTAALNASQAVGKAASKVASSFGSFFRREGGGGEGEFKEFPAETFKKNVTAIYDGLTIDSEFYKINKIPLGNVEFEHNRITIYENNIARANRFDVYKVTNNTNDKDDKKIDKFKTNVLKFYNTPGVLTD